MQERVQLQTQSHTWRRLPARPPSRNPVASQLGQKPMMRQLGESGKQAHTRFKYYNLVTKEGALLLSG